MRLIPDHQAVRGLFLAACALVFMPSPAVAQPTISWTTDSSGFWDVASNWKDSKGNARVPLASDDVLIDRGSIHPVITVRTSQSVHTISGSAPLVVTGSATFSIASTSQLAGGFTLDNGSLSVNGPLTVSGNSIWKSGAILRNGGLTNTGAITLSGSDTKFLGGVLNNSGTIVHQAGTLKLDIDLGFSGNFAGALNNTGVYDIQADILVTRQFLDGDVINNSGTIRKSGGTGTATINTPFVNTGGTLDSESGTLALNTGSYTGGIFSAGVNGNSQATLKFAGSQTFAGAFTGSGKGAVQLNGSQATGGDTFAAGSGGATFNLSTGLFQWVSGLIDGGTDGWRNAGSLTVIEGGSRVIVKNRFDNTGTFVMSGSSAMDLQNCTMTNLPGGVFDFQGEGVIFDAGAGNLVNQGTVRKSTGTLSSINAGGFNNTPNGTIDVRTGTLALAGPHNTGGIFTVSSGAILDLAGSALSPNGCPSGLSTTYSGAYTGSGKGTIVLAGCILRIGSAGATFNFPAGLFQWTGGAMIGGTAALINTGTITLSGSGTKFLGGVLNNAGTVVQMAGALQLDIDLGFSGEFAGVMNNSGLYDLQADLTITRQFLDADIFNNAGVFRKSGGTGAMSILAPFNNTGTVEAKSGSMTVYATQFVTGGAGGASNTLTGGTWHVFSNATLDLVNRAAVFFDVVPTNKADIILDGPGASFPPITAMNSNLGIVSILNGATLSTTGNLTNSGSITLVPAAKLTVGGAYSQTTAAALATQIAGRPSTGQFGQFTSTGAAVLGGAFNATLAAGFGLTSGDSYKVMSFPSHSGSFSTITGSSLGLHADLSPTALTLTAVGTQADLSIATIAIATPTAKPGQRVTVNFTVKNQGGAPATGGWDDSVYVSPSPFIEPNSVLLGKVHHTGDIAAQSSYGGALTVPLPPLLPGGYRVLVVADSGNVVSDANRDNNTGVSAGTIAVSIPLLSVGSPLSDKIASGQDLYYHMVLSPGADVTLSASYAAAEQAELYVRFAALPSRTTFDLSTLSDLSNPNPKLSLNNAQGGDYYVLLHGLASASAGQAFTVALMASQFQITSIEPQAARNSGPQTVLLGGAQFTPQTAVSLVAANGTAYPANSVSFTDSTEITASFDLTKVPVGSYTVRAASSGQTAIASTLFRVTDIVVGNFASTVILSPPEVPVGSPIGVSITVNGVGDSLTPIPLVQVDASNVAAGQEHQQLVDPALPLFFTGSMQFGIGYDPQPHAANVVSGFDLSLISLIQPIDWDSQKNSLRPPDIPADAWDAIWANLRPRLGGIVGDFYALLGKDAGALAAVGVATNRINRLFRFEVALANNQFPVSATSSALDAAFPAPGMPLQFPRTFVGSSIAGRYRLGRLGRGWVDSLDISAVTDTKTKNVTIQQGPITRAFVANSDGSYTATPGDFGMLTQTAGIYQLREKTGITTVFHSNGTLDFIQDTNNNRLTAGYSNGLLTTLTHSNGSALTVAYNGQGRVQQVTDPAGRTAIYAYDGSGDHLLTVTTAVGTVLYSYTPEITGPHAFALASITAPAGTHRFFEYDSQGRLNREQRDGGAEVLNYSYDVASIRMTDAKDRPYTIFYDDFGRVVATLDALGRAQVSQFDDSSNPVRLVACARFQVPCAPANQLNDPTDLSYDPSGNLTGSIDPLGATETSAYDPTFNRLTLATDALSHKTIFGIDASGNSTSATYSDGTGNQRNYDAQGNPIRFTDRNGKVTVSAYDKGGLLTNTQLADGSQITYVYDLHANLVSATNAQGTISMHYDAADRLINITYPKGRSLTYNYDAGGRLRQALDQSGFTVNYNYDQAGRPNAVADSEGAIIISYTYDAAGQLARLEKGNGTYTTFDYDGDGRVLHLVNCAPDNTVNSRFDYTYDALGRRDSVTTLDGQTLFGYDAVGRLTSVTLPGGRTITYVYDAAGNRIGVSDNGTTTAYATNNLNEYALIGGTSQLYDSAGNLRSSGSSSYAYDSVNRLTAVTAASGSDTYEYDALGHRIAATHNGQRTEFLIDFAGNPVAEYNAAGQLVAHYVYGSSLASRVDPNGAPAYYDYDAVGSTAGLTGPTGSYVDRYSYLPFGEPVSVVETIPNSFRYVGAFGVRDDKNGLNYMRARYYNPALGRFTQTDPIGLAGGNNLYSYVSNNPIDSVDPSGLLPIFPAASASGTWISYVITEGAIISGATAYFPAFPIAGAVTVWKADYTISAAEQADYLAWEAFQASLPTGPANPSAYGVGASNYFSGAGRQSFTVADAVAAGQSAARIAAVRNILGGIGRFLGYLGIGAELYLTAKDTYDFFHPLFTGGLLPCFPAFHMCFDIPFITASHGGHTQTIQKPRASKDPNFISGPGGIGPNNFVLGAASLPYYIGFENQPTAGGPAAQVILTETLDPSLDLASFQLGDFGFGNIDVNVPPGLQSYKTRVDARVSRGLFVDVTAQLSGPVITWTFTSIDPQTGQPPTSFQSGFLPPDKNPPEGEGFVTYFIRPRAGIASGALVKAQASVVFDTNAAIATNVYVNALDTGGPTSRITALPSTETATTFTISWSGTDANGPGIASYDIFASTDGGSFQPLLTNTSSTSTTFTGKTGHTYGFYSIAHDQLGNVETSKSAADSTTRISNAAPPTILCTGCYFLVDGVRATLAFKVGVTGSGSAFTYNYRTASQTVQFTSSAVTAVSVNTNTANFSGQGTMNGQTGFTFAVSATDGGGPGSGLDSVSITITGPNNFSHSKSGTIVGGDIVIRQ